MTAFSALSALVLALILIIVAAPQRASAEGASADGASVDIGQRIVDVAMQYEGTHGGQCFPWVRSIIHEATGRAMGFGYHDGFIEGGAVEIPLGSARLGDVLQVANPADNGPAASYPGLHTAIVISPNGDGTFKVIDSNGHWDEMVRVREAYDPWDSASRSPGLTVRAYRFSDAPVDGGIVQANDAELTAGDLARVVTDGGCLRLRSAPGTDSSIVRCLDEGSTVTVLEGTQTAGGFRWQRIRAGSDTGWVADTYLVPLGSVPGPPGPGNGTSAPAEPPASAPQVIGDFPSGGGPALLMWSGGPLSQFLGQSGDRDCNLLSIWITAAGLMVGNIVGAPEFVNRAWLERFPGDLPQTPLLAICARPGSGQQASGSTPPPSPAPAPTPRPSPGDPVTSLPGHIPPGPAGNE